MKRLSFLTVGPSLAGSSEILMASSMAASRPFPPSPLRAGPKHSGRRMSRRTTTLAFSSTLSPVWSRCANVSDSYSQLKSIHCDMKARLTINKDCKAEEIQVSLPSTGVPADVRVALRHEHWTHLQPAASQVRHHLHYHAYGRDTTTAYKLTSPLLQFFLSFLLIFTNHFQVLLLESQGQLVVVNAGSSSHIQRGGPTHACK